MYGKVREISWEAGWKIGGNFDADGIVGAAGVDGTATVTRTGTVDGA